MCSKLSKFCLSILTICYILSNLSPLECSTRNEYSQYATTTSKARIVKRIVGGTFTEKYKNTVVRLDWDGKNFCTGTFIAQNAILTAAHCCVNASLVANDLTIHSYCWNIRVVVLKYHLHPVYKWSQHFLHAHHDIAIIELTKSVKWSIPATLNYRRVKCGDTVWMYGFGRTERYMPGVTDQLKEFSAQVDCRHWWTTGDIKIYTSSFNGSVCYGDSGGPTFNQNGSLVGVHSGGSNCVTAKLAVDVPVSSQKHFIQTFLNQTASSTSEQLRAFKNPIIMIEIPNTTSELSSTEVSESTVLSLKPLGLLILSLFTFFIMNFF